MQNYLDRLSKVQQETGVRILLENLPQGYNHPILKRFFPTAKSTRSVPELRKSARDFGLGLTLDIDHIGVSAPHKEPWFQESLLDVENIHLSSFDDKRRHMPLGEGGLDAVSFLRRLNELRYKGLLTLEVNDPKAITLCSYSFDAIARSAHVVHRVS